MTNKIDINMKKMILFATIYFLTTITFAQSTWTTEIPDYAFSVKVTPNSDSGYTAVGLTGDVDLTERSYRIYKINSDGELIWSTEPITSNDTTIWINATNEWFLSPPKGIIQLENSDYIIYGHINSGPAFAMKICSDGHLMWIRIYEDYWTPELPTHLENFFEMPNNEIWGLLRNEQVCYVIKLDSNGNIIDTFTPLLQGKTTSIMKISANKLLITTFLGSLAFGINFYITDINFNIINEKNYKISPSVIKQNPFSNNIYIYDKRFNKNHGLLILNETLDSIDYIHQDTFYPNPYIFINLEIYDIIFTSDNNIAMTGWIYDVGENNPIYIRCDLFGIPEIIYPYMNVHPNRGTRIFEDKTDKGIIMLQESNNGIYGARTFLVKVFSNGSFTNSIEKSINIYDIKIFPNPAEEIIFINSEKKLNGKITITDTNGKTVVEQQITENTTLALDIGGLFKGVYIITISNNEFIYSTKFTKN